MPTNVQFLANFIARNPGCTPVQARRALCAFNEKKYHRGYYTEYTSGTKYVGPRAQYPYWVSFEGGLYITELGLTKRV